jgi:hypothetical protein
MIFNRSDYDQLTTLFDPEARYAGYRPAIKEAPNGDTKVCPNCDGGTRRSGHPVGAPSCGTCDGSGRVPNVDHQKRYLHVALKYSPPEWAVAHLARAHFEACCVAEALGVPAAYYPRAEFGALRVLWYPEGAGSEEHTDFDLFTTVAYRETPADLERHPGVKADWSRVIGTRRDAAEAISPGLHIGEIGELVGLGPATPHRVPGRPYVQRSIVYFAIPDHAARLPCKAPAHGGWPNTCAGGPTVGEWLADRYARSRVYK